MASVRSTVVVPQPAEALGRSPPATAGRSHGVGGGVDGRGVAAMANTSAGGDGERPGVEDDRQGEPDGQQQAGERRADELVGDELGRVQPAVGPLEVARSSTIAGMNVWALLS